jgi:hypothetical protein
VVCNIIEAKRNDKKRVRFHYPITKRSSDCVKISKTNFRFLPITNAKRRRDSSNEDFTLLRHTISAVILNFKFKMKKKEEGAASGWHKERLRNMKRNEGVRNKNSREKENIRWGGGGRGDERKFGVVDKSNEEEIGRKEGWSKGGKK